MSSILQNAIAPLSMSSALALGMDEESAKLAIQLQMQDLGLVDRPTLADSIPACIARVADGVQDQGAAAQNCIVCLVENVHIRLACGHAVLCEECSLSIRNLDSGVTKCPLCRKYGSVVDCGSYLNMQESYVEPESLTRCDGCKV